MVVSSLLDVMGPLSFLPSRARSQDPLHPVPEGLPLGQRSHRTQIGEKPGERIKAYPTRGRGGPPAAPRARPRPAITVTPLAFESLGVRSMCTLAVTRDVTVLMDAGVALGPEG